MPILKNETEKSATRVHLRLTLQQSFTVPKNLAENKRVPYKKKTLYVVMRKSKVMLQILTRKIHVSYLTNEKH